MAKQPPHITLPGLNLDARSKMPLSTQLYSAVKKRILEQKLRQGVRLPSTRALAGDLGVSRNTVVAAFDQLILEGFLESRVGHGTCVARDLPEKYFKASAPKAGNRSERAATPTLSTRGAMITSIGMRSITTETNLRAFQMGVPPVDIFPMKLWSRLVGEEWRAARPSRLGYQEPEGYRPLREAIAEYLSTTRAVICTPESIMIVSGAQAALDILSRLLLDPGDRVWMEDPGYRRAADAFAAAEAKIIPVPLDEAGMDVERGKSLEPSPRLIYTTPSHQYPTGISMSLPRRMELLDFARSRKAWVIEDDYDSEYRYVGRPLASLQGVDAGERVIYVGTFSKVVFPAMWLGYVVLPEALIDPFRSARSLMDRHSHVIEQGALARFIEGGHFSTHLRRIRSAGMERLSHLLQAAETRLDGLAQIEQTDGGMHVTAHLLGVRGDRAIALECCNQGIKVKALSECCIRARPGPALLLGYAGFSPRVLTTALTSLGEVLRGRSRS